MVIYYSFQAKKKAKRDKSRRVKEGTIKLEWERGASVVEPVEVPGEIVEGVIKQTLLGSTRPKVAFPF